MSIAAKSLGSPRNGMPGRSGYVWRGDQKAAEAERRLARIRAQAARDQQIAAGRARAAGQAEAPPAVITPPAPAPARPRPVKALPPEAGRYRRRDVPTCCPCRWRWDDGEVRWVRFQKRRGCPWHTGRAA